MTTNQPQQPNPAVSTDADNLIAQAMEVAKQLEARRTALQPRKRDLETREQEVAQQQHAVDVVHRLSLAKVEEKRDQIATERQELNSQEEKLRNALEGVRQAASPQPARTNTDPVSASSSQEQEMRQMHDNGTPIRYIVSAMKSDEVTVRRVLGLDANVELTDGTVLDGVVGTLDKHDKDIDTLKKDVKILQEKRPSDAVPASSPAGPPVVASAPQDSDRSSLDALDEIQNDQSTASATDTGSNRVVRWLREHRSMDKKFSKSRRH